MKNKIILVFNIICVSALVYAESGSNKLEREIKEQCPSHERGELAFKGAQGFSEIPGITESQKLSLLKINQETADKAQTIQTEILQTKMVLFKTLATPHYKKTDIENLKKRLVELDQKRLRLMFDSLEQVEKTLANSKASKEEVYKRLF